MPKSATLIKIQVFLITLFLCIGAYLVLSILGGESLATPAKAAGTTRYDYTEQGLTQPQKDHFNCFYDYDRFLNEGRCVPSAFQNEGACTQPGTMAVCNNDELPNDSPFKFVVTGSGSNQYRYGTVKCEPLDCGASATANPDHLINGRYYAPQCGNPYVPQNNPPTNTPTNPPPTNTPVQPTSQPTGSIRVETKCVDGDPAGRRFDLRVDIPNQRNQEFNGMLIGTTTSSIGPLTGFPVDVNVSATNLPSGIRVSRNTCTNGGGSKVNNGGTCTLEFTGCTGPTVTVTPSPTTIRTPQGTFSVVAQCIDGDQRSLNIPFTARNNANNLSGQTPASNVTYQGQGNLAIEAGAVPQSIRDIFPNIQLSGNNPVTISNDGLARFNYTGCTNPVRTPDISIIKTLTSSNSALPNENVTFAIQVTNTGYVDITNFTLTDDYDVRYIRFMGASIGGVDLVPSSNTSSSINPATCSGDACRARLTWENLPPGDQVLKARSSNQTTGDTLTVNLVFSAIIPLGANPTNENDNCGVVQTITYIGTDNQQRVQTVDKRSCAEFNIVKRPTTLRTDVNKYYVGSGQDKVGQNIVFQGIISNNTDPAVTYTDIDFIDDYDTRYVQLVRVRVAKVNNIPVGPINMELASPVNVITGRPANCPAVSLADPLALNDMQCYFGNLEPGQSYVIEMTYLGSAPSAQVCDTITGNVRGENNQTASDFDTECVPITVAPPPDTGASTLLNGVLPFGLLVVGGAAQYFVRRKYFI